MRGTWPVRRRGVSILAFAISKRLERAGRSEQDAALAPSECRLARAPRPGCLDGAFAARCPDVDCSDDATFRAAANLDG